MIQDFLNESNCHFCTKKASCMRTSLAYGFVIMSCVEHITDLNNLYDVIISKPKKPYVSPKEDSKTC